MADTPRILGPEGTPVKTEDASLEIGAFKIGTAFSMETGRAMVSISFNGQPPVQMHPAECRELGLLLILESERVILDAAALRMAMEVMQAHPREAMTVWGAIAMGTRQDHALAYEKAKTLQRQADAMGGTDGTGGTNH